MIVLAQMGLKGLSRLPNGAIRLPDGRVVGEFGLDGMGSGGGGSIGSGGGLVDGRYRRSAYTRGILKGIPLDVQMLVRSLEEEVYVANIKLQVSLAHLCQLISSICQ